MKKKFEDNSSMFIQASVGVAQRWDRTRSAGVDYGRILRFSFGPEVKNLGKTGTGSGVTFQFRQ